MTCAHVVHVALKKMPGVDSVEVSLSKNLAVVKMKPGNTLTVRQIWQVLHSQGYTPRKTTVLVKGDLMGEPSKPLLKVTETGETIPLAADPTNAEAYAGAGQRIGQAAVIRGVMNPGKDLKASAPLQIEEVK